MNIIKILDKRQKLLNFKNRWDSLLNTICYRMPQRGPKTSSKKFKRNLKCVKKRNCTKRIPSLDNLSLINIEI